LKNHRGKGDEKKMKSMVTTRWVMSYPEEKRWHAKKHAN
jgi:hypothetical protein